MLWKTGQAELLDGHKPHSNVITYSAWLGKDDFSNACHLKCAGPKSHKLQLFHSSVGDI